MCVNERIRIGLADFDKKVCLDDCSAKATDEFELARKKVARFINASDSREIVFTRNATEAINLVAYSWGLSNLKPGDEVCAPLVSQ